MRYEIGQELFVINFVFQSNIDRQVSGIYHVPLLFDNEQPINVNILKLTVSEHHKVPNEWDTENKLDCDGFMLRADDGTVYANQYPRASYGQTSDTANRRFNRHQREDAADTKELIALFLKDTTKFYEGNLMTDTMASIEKGIVDLSTFLESNPDNENVKIKHAGLIELRERILQQFAEQFPDYGMVTEQKKFWVGSGITHFQTTIWKRYTQEEAAAMTVDKVKLLLNTAEIVQVELGNDALLVISTSIGEYYLAGITEDVKSIQVCYAEKVDEIDGVAQHCVSGTELFHPDDAAEAATAFLERCKSSTPGNRSDSTASTSIADIAVRQHYAEILRIKPEHLLGELERNGAYSVLLNDYQRLALKRNDAGEFIVVWVQTNPLCPQHNHEKMTKVPATTGLEAAKLFRHVVGKKYSPGENRLNTTELYVPWPSPEVDLDAALLCFLKVPPQ